MEENDPSKKIRRVTGYILNDEVYVLHSIIENNGEYICVTPSPIGNGAEGFDFIIDDKITFIEKDGMGIPFRDGHQITNGFRKNPDEAMRKVKIILTRLDNGASLIEAQRKPI